MACISVHIKSVLMYKFLISVPTIRTLYIYVSDDVRIRGYYSRPEGVLEQKYLRNTALNHGCPALLWQRATPDTVGYFSRAARGKITPTALSNRLYCCLLSVTQSNPVITTSAYITHRL